MMSAMRETRSVVNRRIAATNHVTLVLGPPRQLVVIGVLGRLRVLPVVGVHFLGRDHHLGKIFSVVSCHALCLPRGVIGNHGLDLRCLPVRRSGTGSDSRRRGGDVDGAGLSETHGVRALWWCAPRRTVRDARGGVRIRRRGSLVPSRAHASARASPAGAHRFQLHALRRGRRRGDGGRPRAVV